MGGVCSGGTTPRKRSAKSDSGTRGLGFSGKLKTTRSGSSSSSFSKTKEKEKEKESSPYDSGNTQLDYYRQNDNRILSFSSELKPSTPAITGLITKAGQKGSVLGRAGIVVGLEKAVEVLDTLGSSMSNLNAGSGFISGTASRGNKISILAFEVANTIVKGSNLLRSLSGENIQFLKKDVLNSQGVQILVSTDTNELLTIAAADKREELDVFSREVIRFGDLCKDPQWHNLGRFFSGLGSNDWSHELEREEADIKMHELALLAQHTSELYHEFNALDRFQQDYRLKVEEVEALNLPRRGETLKILQSELKQQRKLVRSLKKKSLWSKSLEEVVEKLVDIVTYAHKAISEAFEITGAIFRPGKKTDQQRLGVAGLALHYANVINQIDGIASRPTSLPPNMRDTLYNGLPNSVKTALRTRLQTPDTKEYLSVGQVKAEMEKTLHWLVPVATNTNKAHQGFGWVGEWANSGPEFGKSTNTQNTPIRLQTLYHADKQKTDLYILELVIWLQHLIRLVRHKDCALRPLPTSRSPTRKGLELHTKMQRFLSMDLSDTNNDNNNNNKPRRVVLISQEDRDLLNDVLKRRKRKVVMAVSKSQEFLVSDKRKITGIWGLSKSTGSSPNRDTSSKRNFECSNNTNVLDVIDGL